MLDFLQSGVHNMIAEVDEDGKFVDFEGFKEDYLRVAG